LVASSRQIIWTKVMAGALIVNVTLTLILIEYFQSRVGNGAIGAATAFLVTEGLMSVVAVIILPALLNQASIVRLLRAAGATLLMAAGVLAVRTLGLPAEMLAGVAIFGALAILFRVIALTEIRGLYSAVRNRSATSVPI
jgi:hypothetical protein